MDELLPALSVPNSGYMQDSEGNLSSKRLMSFIFMACSIIIGAYAVIWHHSDYIQYVYAYGGFSVALQGVSAVQDTNLFRR